DAPSPEARLGLPEVAGVWRFAGWEIVRGDSTSLERTFPSCGELVLETPRLDSIAGTFQRAGGPAPVVGAVRRGGALALAAGAGRLAEGSPSAGSSAAAAGRQPGPRSGFPVRHDAGWRRDHTRCSGHAACRGGTAAPAATGSTPSSTTAPGAQASGTAAESPTGATTATTARSGSA